MVDIFEHSPSFCSDQFTAGMLASNHQTGKIHPALTAISNHLSSFQLTTNYLTGHTVPHSLLYLIINCQLNVLELKSTEIHNGQNETEKVSGKKGMTKQSLLKRKTVHFGKVWVGRWTSYWKPCGWCPPGNT